MRSFRYDGATPCCDIVLYGIARPGKFTLCYDVVLSFVVSLDLEGLLYFIVCSIARLGDLLYILMLSNSYLV